MSSGPLQALDEPGVSIWLDDLSRKRLTSGSHNDLVGHHHVRGVTTNPSISPRRSARRRPTPPGGRPRRPRLEVAEALRALTTFDVRAACDVLRPVYEATHGVDGRVSIEVDARLAHDTAAMIAEARALFRSSV